MTTETYGHCEVTQKKPYHHNNTIKNGFIGSWRVKF